MAITVVNFTNTSGTALAEEIKGFLDTYAASYFDSITIEDDTTISFIIDGVTVLYLPIGVAAIATMQVLGSTSSRSISNGSVPSTFTRGVVTSSGIMLVNSGTNNIHSVTISTDTDGNTVIAALGRPNSSKYEYFFGNLELSPTVTTPWGEATSLSQTFAVSSKAADATALYPLVFSGGSMSDKIFIAGFSQYIGTIGQVTMNGTNYYTDGAVFLKD